MKFIKLLIVALVIAVIYYFVSPQIPPVVSVKNLTPVHAFGDTLALDVTITNYTPHAKEISLSSSDLKQSLLLYVDTKPLPASEPISEVATFSKMTIEPFGHQSVTLQYQLRETGTKSAQEIPGDASVLQLSSGNHTYAVSWGGYLSGEQKLGVQ